MQTLRAGKQEHLIDEKIKYMMKEPEEYIESKVDVPLLRRVRVSGGCGQSPVRRRKSLENLHVESGSARTFASVGSPSKTPAK